MTKDEHENTYHHLCEALNATKKRIEHLEAAFERNKAYFDPNIRYPGPAEPKVKNLHPNLLDRIGLVGQEPDISDYIGPEGHHEKRPRLGQGAPPSLLPNKEPPPSELISQLACTHPSDAITFDRPEPVNADAPHAGARPGPFAPGDVVFNSGQSLAEDSADVIGRFGPQGEVLYISPNISRYCTAKPCDVIGKKITDIGDLPSSGIMADGVAKVIASGRPLQVEGVLESLFTGAFIADCRFWPEFDVNGNVIYVSVLIRDMTHVRRMTDNYYALFNNMEDGFILFEYLPGWQSESPAYAPDNFAIVTVNPAFARTFGLVGVNIAGIRVSELMGVYAKAWAACLGLVLDKNRPAILPLHSDTPPGEYEISAYCPEYGRVACIVKDVTELRRIEQETRLNESRLAALYRLQHMDAAPEDQIVRHCLEQAVGLTGSEFGYIYVSGGGDADNGKLYWSRGAVSVLGHNDDAKNGHDSSSRGKNGRNPGDGHGQTHTVKGPFKNPFDGDVQVSRHMLAPIAEEERIVCIAGVANKRSHYSPSELRQLELFINGMWFHLRRRRSIDALRQAKEAAEAASKAKNEFLANISHELRTPLNGILGLLQVLQLSELSDEQKEYVNTAAYSSRSLLRIISDILDFSRIEAGLFTLSPQVFDFTATIRSALGMFIYPAGNDQVRFFLIMDEAIPKLLFGDDARLRQIVVNLVGNAFKFTSKGGISVECHLLPYHKNGKTCIYLAVSDTGIGIHESKFKDIFKAFTQLDSSSTRRYPGIGLGLAIVQRLVRLMNGSLFIESTPGKGTAIHCSLPFDEPPASALPKSDETVITLPPEPLDLLLVEDDLVNQFSLRTLLKKIGYDSICVDNGQEAIEALGLRAFDCIITDIRMPVMDGMELARRIREGDTGNIVAGAKVRSLLGIAEDSTPTPPDIPRDIPIIALTAHVMESDRNSFLGIGMDYYLAKPVILSELIAMLSHVSMLVRARQTPVKHA